MKSNLGIWRRGAGMVLSVGLAAGMLAGCDDSAAEECDEMGCGADAFVSECERNPSDCEPDDWDGSDGEPAEFSYVIVDDISNEIAANGTPGVDICSVVAVCGGDTVLPIGAELGVGEEYICGEPEPPAGITCEADRNDPAVALVSGSCDASSNPSDYVSLGGGGRLTLTFGRDLQGCTIQVFEATGTTARAEAAEVAVCADTAASECLTIGGDVVLGTVEEGANPASFEVPVFE